MKARPEISFQCPARSQVEGTGPVRYCHLCDRAVHNLSAMTEDEAENFLRLCGTQKLCIGYRTEDGQVVHRSSNHFGRITLALGLGLGGLAVAVVPREEAPPQPGAGGASHMLSAPHGQPTNGLRSLVQQALQEAEHGWPKLADEAEAREQRARDFAKQFVESPERVAYTPPPPVPVGHTMGTFSPPLPAEPPPVVEEVDGLLMALDHQKAEKAEQADHLVPERLSRQQILMVVKRGAVTLRECKQEGATGTLTVAMVIEPEGNVSSAEVTSGPMQGTTAGHCVEEVVRGLVFPKFSGPAMKLNMPFAL
jgi:hypothetical protein